VTDYLYALIIVNSSKMRIDPPLPTVASPFVCLRGQKKSKHHRTGAASTKGHDGWVAGFVCWYDEVHRHSALRFVTPGQRHRGEDIAILAQGETLYQAAKTQHPER